MEYRVCSSKGAQQKKRTGRNAEYLDVPSRNCDAARALDDPALQATAEYWHVDALCMAARFPAALAAIMPRSRGSPESLRRRIGSRV
jgi:hypothetical protein